MTRIQDTASDEHLIDDLRELIAAIERRVPHLERAGEFDIARDAAALKAKALARIAASSKPTDTPR